MDTEPTFDAADLADAILGSAETSRARVSVPPPPPVGPSGGTEPCEPITQETPVVPAWAAPPPAPARVWSDAQRALFLLAVILLVVALIGVAAMSGSVDDGWDPPCEDAPGLFDDDERGLFDVPDC